MKIEQYIFVSARLAKPTIGLALFLSFALLPSVRAAVVTTTADSGAGSLRHALTNASSGDVITFNAGLSGQTLVLTNGQLSVTKNLSIDASTLPAGFHIDGRGLSRVVRILPSLSVTLDSLTLTNGSASGEGGGGILLDSGATVTLNNCSLVGNSAGTSGGGGIRMDLSARLTLNRSTLSSNRVTSGFGGGIFMAGGGTLTINNSTLTGNSTTGWGGGIYSQNDTVALNHSTVSRNTGSLSGGGINMNVSFGSLTLTNTIVAGNSAPNAPNIAGAFVGDHSLTNGDPLLAPLGKHGGLTQTMPLLPGSPAIDAGTATTLTTDQRGFARVVGNAPDIGAVEGVFSPVGFGPLTGTSKLGDGSLQFSFTNYSGMPHTVLGSTDAAAPLDTWSNLGLAVEEPPGYFQFTDLQATNHMQRFYRVRVP